MSHGDTSDESSDPTIKAYLDGPSETTMVAGHETRAVVVESDGQEWTQYQCIVCGEDFGLREDTFRFSLHRPADAAAGEDPYEDVVHLHLDCAPKFLEDPLSYSYPTMEGEMDR